MIKRLINSLRNAFNGARLSGVETSIKIEVFAATVVTIAGIFFEITPIEWALQTICIMVVLGFEIMNTAIEELCDFVNPNYHSLIKKIKDLSAGAVLVAAIGSVIVACIIYIPRILEL